MAIHSGRKRKPLTTAFTPSKRSKKLNGRHEMVDINALPWVTDEYGIQTIDDVDVFKDGDDVKFLVHGGVEKMKQARGKGGGEEKEEEKTWEEWEGFEDSTSDAGASDKGNALERCEGNASKKPENKPRKQAKSAKKAEAEAETLSPATSSGNAFSALSFVEEPSDPQTDTSAWLPLKLSPAITASIARLGFTEPTPIQTAAIPEIVAGHDVIGKASTGSGKTLAFAIPIVEEWLAVQESRVAGVGETKNADPGSNDSATAHALIALILSPTRELAHQITKHITAFCAALPAPPRVCSVTGGLSIQKQQRQLATADIVVGTPGRLWEVIEGSDELLGAFQRVRFLVVDEADRILLEGHFKEAEEVISALDKVFVELDPGEDPDPGGEARPNPNRQTLVFSATFNKGLQQKLAGKRRHELMNDKQSMEYLLKKLNFREEEPKFIDVNPVSRMADGLREGYIECGAMEKDVFLYASILLAPSKRTLVFTNSITAVRRIMPMLKLLRIPALPLHSQMPQKARLRSVERFTEPQQPVAKGQAAPPAVLVATDVAARGLDIPGVEAIVHYHVPRTADAYVHRSGRTARGAQTGLSVLLCSPEEVVPMGRLAAKVHAGNASAGKNRGYVLRSIELDSRIPSRLKERVALAKKIADAELAKEKGRKEDDWVRAAADELGVDVDEVEEAGAGRTGWGGRGSGRKKREAEARETSKAEISVLKAKLREAMARRINTGVSERYVAAGGVNVGELLEAGISGGIFLGSVDRLAI